MALPSSGKANCSRGIHYPAWKVIGWWEKRRVLFNLAVLGAGLVACGLIWWLERSVLPLTFVFWVAAYALGANAAYTLGPLTEAVWGPGPEARSERVRRRLFRAGLVFSVGLTLALGVLIPLASRLLGFFH